jgi:hypothetical protein
MVTWARALPYVNLAIASSALTFQVTVLYPWHEKLEADFKALQSSHEEQLRRFHALKLERLDKHEEQLQRFHSLKLERLEKLEARLASVVVAT